MIPDKSVNALFTLSIATAVAHEGLSAALGALIALEINPHFTLVATFSVLFHEYFNSMPVAHIAGNIADSLEHFWVSSGVFQTLRGIEKAKMTYGIGLEEF